VTSGPPKTIAQRWAALSPGARYGIYGGAGALVLFALMTVIFCCIKQRRIGKADYIADNNELRQKAMEADSTAYSASNQIRHSAEFGSFQLETRPPMASRGSTTASFDSSNTAAPSYSHNAPAGYSYDAPAAQSYQQASGPVSGYGNNSGWTPQAPRPVQNPGGYGNGYGRGYGNQGRY
jgi:hypothetical protein